MEDKANWFCRLCGEAERSRSICRNEPLRCLASECNACDALQWCVCGDEFWRDGFYPPAEFFEHMAAVDKTVHKTPPAPAPTREEASPTPPPSPPRIEEVFPEANTEDTPPSALPQPPIGEGQATQPSQPPPAADPASTQTRRARKRKGRPPAALPNASAWPPAVLYRCTHGAWQLAAGVLPSDTGLTLCEICDASHDPPWWKRQNTDCAVRCPHGFASATNAHIDPPTKCSSERCLATAAQYLSSARAAHPKWPAKTDPIRWVGEFDARSINTLLTLPYFLETAPPFDVVALHEHTGAFRDEWAKQGFAAASVANRPTSSPPVKGAVHFIADVVEWRSAYQWSIPMATANPDCHTAAIAAPNSAVHRWQRHLRSGALDGAVEHFAWLLDTADAIAIEQPPTLLAWVFGPPEVKTSFADFGIPLQKEWHWWLRRVDQVLPANYLPGPHPSSHHDNDDLPQDLRSISRASTPPEFAKAHVAAWAPTLRFELLTRGGPEPMQQPPQPAPGDDIPRSERALASLTLVAAAKLAPCVASPFPPRCVIVIPASRLNGVPVLLLPRVGFFGSAVWQCEDLDAAAYKVASLLACRTEPMLAHIHSEEGVKHFVYVAPPDYAPTYPTLHKNPPKSSCPAWRTEEELGDSDQRVYASLALRRLTHVFTPTTGDTAIVGVSGPPRPLVANAEARLWARTEPSEAAAAEWEAFLEQDALEAAGFKSELAAADRGDGRMIEWAATVSSVRTIAAEITPPPQGLPVMPQGAMWLPFPDLLAVPDPLPLTSQMLARLPPQSVPPGPLPKHALDALKGWFVKALFETTDAIVARERHFFENPPPEGATKEQLEVWLATAPKAPPDLLAGEGAFQMIPHADGVGHWRANCVIFDVAADGALTVMDTTAAPFTPWLLDKLREVFDPADDLELLSHVFDGLRYKASKPRQMRIAANMDSLGTHVRPIADDIAKLRKAGMYKVRPLEWLTGRLATAKRATSLPLPTKKAPRIWPIRSLPAWTSPVGAVDKKDKVFEKRRISNGSWPYGLPQTREGPHGSPVGPSCRSFNELSGPMRPPEDTTPPDQPYSVTKWGADCDFCGSRVQDSTKGAHTWWGRLYCWPCWHRGDHVVDEPFKWHKERKHSPATLYRALATLLAIARQCHQWIFVIITDFRWWFWQFGIHPDEYWTSQFIAVANVGGDYAVCVVGELVANMGRSPVSNVASAVGSRLFTPVRARADAREPALALEDPLELREIVAERRRRLGPEHARLYWSGCFTDDSASPCIGRKRSALLARDVIECNDEAGVLMADLPKNPVGTWGDHIGARLMANAGFGTLTPRKRTRALKACHDISASLLSPKDFESSAGLLGHVVQILALDKSLLNGLGHQHRFAVAYHHATVSIAADCRANVLQLEYAISRTCAASFASAIPDHECAPMGTPLPPIIMSSDACTGSHDPVTLELVDARGARNPAIFGHALGFCFRFPLEGEWRRVHITITEALGPALGALILAPLLPYAKFLLQMDATAAVAFVLGRSHSRKLQRIYAEWRKLPGIDEFVERSSAQHIAGKCNTIDDAGSRGHWMILRAYATACAVQLTFVGMDTTAQAFVDWVLTVALQEEQQEARPRPARGARFGGRAAGAHAEPSGGRTARESPTVGPSSSTPREDEVIKHMVTSPRRANAPALIKPAGTQTPEAGSPPPRRHRSSERPRVISPARPSPARRSAAQQLEFPPSSSERAQAPEPPQGSSAAKPEPPTQTRVQTPRLVSPPARRPPALIAPAPPSAASPPHGRRQSSQSLRPTTAAAVRAMAAVRAAGRLLNDTSPYALCPSDPAKLRSIISNVDDRNADAREASTRGKDNWGWSWWTKACEALDTPPIRPTEELDELRESYVASFALMYTAMHMKPRSKSDSAARPQSAWDAYSHSRTVLGEYGCLLPKQALVRRTLKGTLRNFVRSTFDDEILVPRRKQPFSRAHEKALVELLLTGRIVGWTRRACNMMLWETAFARCVGARKAEICAGGKYFSRRSLRWFLKGKELRPTPENIARADRLQITPVASKSDPFNMNWGGCIMTFDLIEGEHMSVALAMRALELAYPVPPSERDGYPLFFDADAFDPTTGSRPEPTTSAWLTSRFASLMRTGIGVDAAASRSWHSWRVTLACALRAAVDSDHPDGRSLDVVKLFGRWRSDAAVKLYARLTPDAYAKHVSASLRADAAHLTDPDATEAMQNVDPMDLIDEVGAIADAAEGDATKVPRPPPPPANAPARDTTSGPGGSPDPANKRRDKRGTTGTATSVIVPKEVYPTETCEENGGIGWSATATPHGKGTSKVTFEQADKVTGTPFGEVYLRSACLLPLPNPGPEEPRSVPQAPAGKGKRARSPKLPASPNHPKAGRQKGRHATRTKSGPQRHSGNGGGPIPLA